LTRTSEALRKSSISASATKIAPKGIDRQEAEGRFSLQRQELAAIQRALEQVQFNETQIDSLSPGLKRDTLQLANEILAAWAEHEASRPAPAVFAATPPGSDRATAWADRGREEWDWGQVFFRRFAPRVLAILNRLLQSGVITQEQLRDYRWRYFTTGLTRPDDARDLAQQLGAIALNMP
jgi:hypothetical protein